MQESPAEPQESEIEPVTRDFRSDVGLREEDNRPLTTKALSVALYAFAYATKPIVMAMRRNVPLSVLMMMNFLSLRQSDFNIGDPAMRKAGYYVCMAAEQAGRKSVSYEDYQTGQDLDPNISQREATYSYGPSGDVLFSMNPYAQLSISFGQAEFQGNQQAGYSISDGYNFNLNRDKRVIRAASQYVATIGNIEALIKRVFNGEVGGGLIGAIEEILVMYEHTLRYTGFRLMLQTIQGELPEPAEQEEV